MHEVTTVMLGALTVVKIGELIKHWWSLAIYELSHQDFEA
ncbi:hypothetical protein DFP78_113190 [Photobacterium lutimaris]|nr:hypothetical protein DFP78_113190 [Photobacterium lutimaris]